MNRILLVILSAALAIALIVFLQQKKEVVTYEEVKLTRPVFSEPKPGDRLRIRLNTGRIVEGEVQEIAGEELVMATEAGTETVARPQISDESRRLIFRKDYENIPATNRPSVIDNRELLRRIASGETTLNSNVEYVIMGDKSVFFMFPAPGTNASAREKTPVSLAP